ncbi:MAG: hypothetical protein CK425_04500 [Parachlamydia sp.]|nr:MAG: hypothetical protein CK425_04500 [Parachlamydia sp.]
MNPDITIIVTPGTTPSTLPFATPTPVSAAMQTIPAGTVSVIPSQNSDSTAQTIFSNSVLAPAPVTSPVHMTGWTVLGDSSALALFPLPATFPEINEECAQFICQTLYDLEKFHGQSIEKENIKEDFDLSSLFHPLKEISAKIISLYKNGEMNERNALIDLFFKIEQKCHAYHLQLIEESNIQMLIGFLEARAVYQDAIFNLLEETDRKALMTCGGWNSPLKFQAYVENSKILSESILKQASEALSETTSSKSLLAQRAQYSPQAAAIGSHVDFSHRLIAPSTLPELGQLFEINVHNVISYLKAKYAQQNSLSLLGSSASSALMCSEAPSFFKIFESHLSSMGTESSKIYITTHLDTSYGYSKMSWHTTCRQYAAQLDLTEESDARETSCLLTFLGANHFDRWNVLAKLLPVLPFVKLHNFSYNAKETTEERSRTVSFNLELPQSENLDSFMEMLQRLIHVMPKSTITLNSFIQDLEKWLPNIEEQEDEFFQNNLNFVPYFLTQTLSPSKKLRIATHALIGLAKTEHKVDLSSAKSSTFKLVPQLEAMLAKTPEGLQKTCVRTLLHGLQTQQEGISECVDLILGNEHVSSSFPELHHIFGNGTEIIGSELPQQFREFINTDNFAEAIKLARRCENKEWLAAIVEKVDNVESLLKLSSVLKGKNRSFLSLVTVETNSFVTQAIKHNDFMLTLPNRLNEETHRLLHFNGNQTVALVEAAAYCLMSTKNFETRISKNFPGLEQYLQKCVYIPDNKYSTTSKTAKAALCHLIMAFESKQEEIRSKAIEMFEFLCIDYKIKERDSGTKNTFKKYILGAAVAYYKSSQNQTATHEALVALDLFNNEEMSLILSFAK